jgi:arylformamidase
VLDAQYDTSRQLPDGDVAPYLERFALESETARASLHCDLNRRYGEHPRETIDFFPAARGGAPLFVWVHGGYWRRMSKDASSLVAPPLIAAGAAVAVVNYPLAPGPTLAARTRTRSSTERHSARIPARSSWAAIRSARNSPR